MNEPSKVLRTDHAEIQRKVSRITRALELKPELGLGTGISTARIEKGLSCNIREGPWKLNADMPIQAGGSGNAPTPGVLGRAALSSCLAIGYMIWAAKLNVPIDALEVEVQADWNDGGTFGTAEIPAGYSEVRYCVRIQSEAPEEEIIKVIDAGDHHSPYLDVFKRQQTCIRNVEITTY